MKDRLVLGINDGHNASACLLKNGEIVACISEERLNRMKIYSDFPVLSIKKILQDNNINSKEIEIIAFSSKDIVPANLKQIGDNKNESRFYVKTFSLLTEVFPIGLTEGILGKTATKSMQLLKYIKYLWNYKKILKELELENSDVVFYDHHMSHAATAYYFSKQKKKALVFTCDGEGDGLCATVNICDDNEIKRDVSIPFVHSIGKMYNEVTWYLGLSPWQDENKVMGLAPYAKNNYDKDTWKVFEKNISVEERKFRNNLGVWADSYAKYLRKKLYKHRFDSIAYSIQRLTENVLTEWISNNIEYYNIENIMLSGGVFMNVKANQKILEMDNVKSLFIVPSSGDESSAIGAAILGYLDLCKKDGIKPHMKDITTLYLGPSYDKVMDDFVKKIDKKQFRVSLIDDINGVIADLLIKGKVVARFDGRMEFGARALGNRSILANPRDLDITKSLNEEIKQRDFWMPFAPTITRERCEEYLSRPKKKVDDQYMVVSFDASSVGKKELKAAIHPADFTCRPQVLDKSWNENYYEVIKYFENETGVGGILNTSFNLHGEPMVCSPKDAISTMERSGLKYLVLGNYLIEKIR